MSAILPMLRPSHTFARYFALESPGWALAALVLSLLTMYAGLEVWIAATLWTLWVAKDFALYPWLRDAYELGNPDATVSLIGRVGEARERIAPEGYVRIGSELWRAELAPGCQEIDVGSGVRVQAVRGLTLVVEPHREAGRS